MTKKDLAIYERGKDYRKRNENSKSKKKMNKKLATDYINVPSETDY
jgi:hypothetical protein